MQERRKEEVKKKVEVWGVNFMIDEEEIVCGVSPQGSFSNIEEYKATLRGEKGISAGRAIEEGLELANSLESIRFVDFKSEEGYCLTAIIGKIHQD